MGFFDILPKPANNPKISAKPYEINEIRMDNSRKGEVLLTVSTYSTEKLYEFYRKLIGNNLVISSESENSGVFMARLKVTLKR